MRKEAKPMELLKTENNVWHYLSEKRGELIYRAQEAEDLKNIEGAKLIRIAAESIHACMNAINYK